MDHKLSIFTLLLSAVLFSCSSTKNSGSTYSWPTDSETADGITLNESDQGMRGENPDRKIIFNAQLSLAVDIPDSANGRIVDIAKKYGGYVHESGTFRSAIRVKSVHLQDAVRDISDLGKVRSKSISGYDVTEEYYDYQIRLDNAEKSRKRYLELLAKAENVQAALKVEKELERLNETIDLLKGKMNRIDHLSEYSTIFIEIKERKKPGLLGYIGVGIYHAVKWLFVRN